MSIFRIREALEDGDRAAALCALQYMKALHDKVQRGPYSAKSKAMSAADLRVARDMLAPFTNDECERVLGRQA